MTRAQIGSVSATASMPGSLDRSESKERLGRALLDVVEVAFDRRGRTDLRQGILTAVYNYDTEEFEIRWDLAK